GALDGTRRAGLEGIERVASGRHPATGRGRLDLEGSQRPRDPASDVSRVEVDVAGRVDACDGGVDVGGELAAAHGAGDVHRRAPAERAPEPWRLPERGDAALRVEAELTLWIEGEAGLHRHTRFVERRCTRELAAIEDEVDVGGRNPLIGDDRGLRATVDGQARHDAELRAQARVG